jgi:hypothetical protein
MSEAQSDTNKALAQETSPYGYPYWEWVARENPEYAKARISLSALSVGEGIEICSPVFKCFCLSAFLLPTSAVLIRYRTTPKISCRCHHNLADSPSL